MRRESDPQRLSQLSTLWSLVLRTQEGPTPDCNRACRDLLERYGGAVQQYLRGALREADAAADLYQDFSRMLLEGRLGGADPHRGRFRDFVRGVLQNLVADYHRRRNRRPRQLPEVFSHPAAESGPDVTDDEQFLATWRSHLLLRCWTFLEEQQRRTGQPVHWLLRLRTEHPKLPSHKIAEELERQWGKRLSAAGVRQLLHRARERFSDRLLQEVADTLDQPGADDLEQELVDLNLHAYLKPALNRWRRQMNALSRS
jgi:RNA polymerase sigma factor (sigma-70 family)